MKKFALLSLLVLPALALRAQNTALPLLNNSFENGLNGWKIPADEGISTLSTEQAASGKSSLKIVDDDEKNGSDVTASRVPINGAGLWTLHGKAFPVSGSGLGIYVRVLDKDGNLLGQGELILANLWQLQSGQGSAVIADYFQDPPVDITITLDADLSPQENANRLFERARHGEKNRARLEELHSKMMDEIGAIERAQQQLQDATSLDETSALRALIGGRGWFQSQQSSPEKASRAADFGGKKIRSYTSPEGWQIFVGDNAEANDYLVQRLGQSNDWWLHLRAGTSAHALIKTNNAPAKVPRETLEFAARLVVQRSAAKHAGVVAVDYTLKKYVRKPRRSAPGSVTYSHEKTLHVGTSAIEN